MSAAPIDLSDPAFEPSDEQLTELSRRAFAEVGRKNREALERVERAIAVRRAAVLERLAARQLTRPSGR